MNKYTPEQLKYELGACWEVDEIADLMAACGLEAADALDVLDAPTDKHEDVIWMACRMMPSVCAAFARRCAEDAGTNAASASATNAAYTYAAASASAYATRYAAALRKYRGWLREEL